MERFVQLPDDFAQNAHVLVESPDNLETKWLHETELRSVLRAVSADWFHDSLRPTVEELGMIRREVWDAECHLQPYPEIAAVTRGETVVGLLCGYRSYHQKYFFIQHIAIHPDYSLDETNAPDIGSTLITAAIDLSVQMGCYGWVATSPVKNSIPFWIDLGFSKYDEFTYRKMGYFA